MDKRCFGRFVAIGALLVSIASAQSTRPTTGASRADADVEIPVVLQKAIATLTGEMESTIKNPAAGKRRVKCEFFTKPDITIDPGVLIKVLNQRLNKDARVDAYIKWQLLSIQKGQFPDELARPAIKLYAKVINSPLELRPGSGVDGEMSAKLATITKEEVPALDQQWQEQLATHQKLWEVQLDYRDELYARLPRTPAVVRMAFRDAELRAQRGYPIYKLVNRLGADMRSVASGMKPVEITQLIAVPQQYSGKEGLKAYNGVQERNGKISWKIERTEFNKTVMQRLVNDLNEMSKAGF